MFILYLIGTELVTTVECYFRHSGNRRYLKSALPVSNNTLNSSCEEISITSKTEQVYHDLKMITGRPNRENVEISPIESG